MSEDLTFITNEEGNKLSDRFNTLIKNTKFFDCLVGYFYKSGFHQIYKSLEGVDKIRILIGISTNKQTYELIKQSRLASTKEIKDAYEKKVVEETENAEDTIETEQGIRKFIEWIKSRKLEIRAYPDERIHAKLYIMTFKEGSIDKGRIVTGSSNLTQAGLNENLEFNIELKNRSDYDFALKKFNELWKNSIDVSEKYVETIKQRTWLNDEIQPYDLYLKFLYEYLKEKINIDQEELSKTFLPENFMDLEYQKDAVRDAKMKLEEYGGVFISDVVGLGKTFISALLTQQLDGRTLVIAPPTLLDKNNPGSWPNVFDEFGVRQREFESLGKLDGIIKRGTEKYKNIIIDESHRFRTESTQMYEKLFRICRGKRVILVSATPLNNTPLDILGQIKLFQNAHKSTLPNPKVRDLEKYFKNLQNKLKTLDRQKDKEEYLKVIQENAEDIRENVLQYLMVRRTRGSIRKYYGKDLERQKLKFPEVIDPQPIVYHFDEKLDEIFNKTLELIIKKLKYSRYIPMGYYTGKTELSGSVKVIMGQLMKILSLKRLESSFFAFKKTIERFIYSYKRFIEEYNKGYVYVSKKYINRVFELAESDDEESIQKLIESGDVTKYPSKEFSSGFIKDLREDLKILEEINDMWKKINRDPKLDKFVEILSKDKILKEYKLIVFTESKETGFYLEDKLKNKHKVLAFSSKSSGAIRGKVIDNFDPAIKNKQDDIRILISTDILSEGVNLNRSNVVINYDIPWNPIKMMQRVGRINRVSKNPPFDKIYTYNFFPAGPINEKISLKEAAEAKIKAFIEMLGNDAKLLTDEEIKSHDFLFKRLNSKETISGEDGEEDAELKYLTFLREIRDNNKDLFEKIKRLPKKARTARKYKENQNSVLTFFRKGKLRKTFITKGSNVEEIDFENAAKILEVSKNEKKEKLDAEFYKGLDRNKKEFDEVFIKESEEPTTSRGRSNENKIIKIIKAIHKSKEFTEEDEEYLQDVLDLLKEGGIDKSSIKRILKSIEKEINPLKILAKIKSGIPQELFRGTFVTGADISGPREVILSEYLLKNG